MEEVAKVGSVILNTSGVVVRWTDGHLSVYSPLFLRLRCPCAHCVDEWSGDAILDEKNVPGDIEVIDYLSVGNYALQFLWTDGHHTGIFTYKFLRTVCTCELCIAQQGLETC